MIVLAEHWLDGIYKYMEDNKFKLSILFLIFISSNFIAVVNAQSINKVVSSVLNNSIEVETTESVKPKILLDSTVIIDEFNMFGDIEGVSRIGKFVFEKDIGNLGLEVPKNTPMSSSINSLEKNYKLVEMPSKELLITDGSFIVTFNNSFDKDQFTSDYNLNANLQTQLQIPGTGIYRWSQIGTLEALMNNLRNDPRVLKVELNLINPYIVPR